MQIKPLKAENNDVSDTMILLRKNANNILSVVTDMNNRKHVTVDDVEVFLTAAENIHSWANELAVMMLTGSERWRIDED